MQWLVRKLIFLWVRVRILPAEGPEFDAGVPVCYVLESTGASDMAVLDEVCQKNGLPAPRAGLGPGGKLSRRSVFGMTQRRLLGFAKSRPTVAPMLSQLVGREFQGPPTGSLIVPVAIFWGRSPQRERGLLKILAAESWTRSGPLRRILRVIVHGRDVMLRFSEPLNLAEAVKGAPSAEVASRKVSRVLRIHYRNVRVATVGPDVSHRRTLVGQITRTAKVRAAIADEVDRTHEDIGRVQAKARRYGLEIAADYSHALVRVGEKVFRRLWHRIYDGIEIRGLEGLRALAEGREIVYVPCHRSHIDYMLLSYIIYLEGLVVPHVAAGVNLNLPVVGRLLRKFGAFFLRRTFGGNRLYASVFDAYLEEILARGFPVEYFIEGGRSRTGFMLRPKGGMLQMTIRAWLKNRRRPLVFVPVYFGYEKLIEGDAFISELSGSAKSRETLAGLIRSLRRLREDFGSVYVAFGEPLELASHLDASCPGWHDSGSPDEAQISAAVASLGPVLLQRINESAVVTPVGLLAMILLAMPKQAMPESELTEQIDLCRTLLEQAGYGPRVSVTGMSSGEIVSHGEALGVVARRQHPLGDIIHTPPQAAVRMTFFRNNLLHTLLAPALVASCFVHRRDNTRDWVEGFGAMIYPYLRDELCLRWSGEEFRCALDSAADTLVSVGLLDTDPVSRGLRAPRPGTRTDAQLQVLGRMLLPVFQCHYLAIALLIRYGSGTVTARQLERLCQMSAQRLTLLYELDSPDLFQRSRFQGLIAGLQSDGLLHPDHAGRLGFGSELTEIEKIARRVLGQEMRHSILSAAILPEVTDHRAAADRPVQ